MRAQRLKRMLGAAALVAAAVAAGGPTGAAAPLSGYKGLATAVVIRVYPSFPALTIADPPVQVDAPHTTVTITSGPAGFARSSVLWPGDIIAHMGSLLAQADPRAAGLPNYPVVAEAQSPGGKSHMEGGPGVGVMDAFADGPLAEAVGTLAGAGVAGAVAARSTTSTSRADFKGSSVVVTATSVLDGLDIMGGLITAESVHTTATATSDGVKGSGGGTTVVTGLKVNGVPARIDSEGIHAADTNQAVPNPDKQISDALAAAGVRIQVASPVDSTEGAGINRIAAGLLVRIPLPPTVAQVSGASIMVSLASASAAANGSRGAALVDLSNDTVVLSRDDAGSDDPGLPPAPTVESDLFDGDVGLGAAPDGAPTAVALPGGGSEDIAFDATEAAYRYGGISWLALLTVVGLALVGAGWVRRWLSPFIVTRSSS